MATFRFELSNKPNRNKKYMLMLCVTVAGKRKRIKTPIELDKPGDFNPKCRGENWIRASVVDSKALNAQLADILNRAKETYKELDKDGGSGVIPWQSYPKMIDKRYMKNGRSDTPCS